MIHLIFLFSSRRQKKKGSTPDQYKNYKNPLSAKDLRTKVNLFRSNLLAGGFVGALKTKNASTEAARGLVREIVAKAHTELPTMKATFVQICPSDYFTRKVSMKFTA